MRSRFQSTVGVSCFVALLAATPAVAITLGVMGDSLSDEYAEESYGSYALNWVEQLVIYGGVTVGAVGTWGEPRRTRYEYNWARSGATSDTLISEGQHTGLAAQIDPEAINYVVMAIGANDFIPGGTAYNGIYSGVWTTTNINNYIASRAANFNLALDTVLATGVELALVSVPDYGVTPYVQSVYPSAAGRQLVADVISQLNLEIDAIAQTRQLPLVDFESALLAIFGTHSAPNTTLTIGDVAIDLTASDTVVGGNPTAGFVQDGVHPNTTLQGIIANVFMEALNVGYGAGIPLFTEAEILSHRGIAYGGSDTLTAEFGNYSEYIVNYVPEPSTACSDTIDNDGDGLIDLDDPDCTDPNDPLESPDEDEDLVQDSLDNCVQVANPDQEDTDADDYGNTCDCDFNQSLTCNIDDFNIFLPDFQSTVDSGVGTDMDASSNVGIADFNLFLPGFVAGAPGPSGVAECIAEGDARPVVPGALPCCLGLVPIPCDEPAGPLCEMCTGASICTNCGNGVCGLGENVCNCPEDCTL
jgi:lysophospholipase L1-like esterase